MEDNTNRQWHLDRRLPMVFIISLLLQSGAALVWAGQWKQRLIHVEETVAYNTTSQERITRLEEQVMFMRASLQRIEHKIDRVLRGPVLQER